MQMKNHQMKAYNKRVSLRLCSSEQKALRHLMRKHIYREIQTGWGIHITITCIAYEKSHYPGQMVDAHPCLFLSTSSAFQQSWDSGFLVQLLESCQHGLQLIEAELCEKRSEPTVIEINEIGIIFTDFQIEGVGYAIAEWIIEEYNLEIELPAVKFDKLNNYYIYPYAISNNGD
ncbi:MAG: hypothetical protein ACPG7F_14725 [Aggregatilineales bacterium]